MKATVSWMAAVLALGLGLGSCRGQKRVSAVGYNLLVVTLDTTRADRIGAYGYARARTPRLDQLAREGLLFSDCTSAVPLTLPSHCTLFTGRYPFQHGVRDNGTYVLPDSETTLAEALRDRGYTTGAVAAAFVLLGKFGLNQGFAAYDDSLDSHVMYNNYSSEIRADRVCAKFCHWLDQAGTAPFFAWLHFYDPHMPYHAPKAWADRFPADMSGSYDAEVAFMDEFVGRSLDALARAGRLDDTLVVIVGDHGEGFGEHQESGHGIFGYQECLRVPLIIHNRRLFPAPRQIGQRVGLVDILPTLGELYGLRLPGKLPGRSLLPLLTDGGGAGPVPDLYFESLYGREQFGWAPLTGIISGDFKYVSLPEAELYDLRQDRSERRNLLLPKNRQARELDARLARMLAASARTGGARRDLNEQDLRQLRTLGYISAFSARGPAGLDPKRGIVVNNQLTRIFQVVKQDPDAAERQMAALVDGHPEVKGMVAYYDLQQQIHVQRRQPLLALQVLRQGVEKFPQDEALFITYALQLSALNRSPEAETYCLRLLEKNPRFTRAYILLGEIAERRRQNQAAAAWYDKALQLEPENVSLQLKVAELTITAGNYSRALELYDRLLQQMDVARNPSLLYKIAIFQAQHGRTEKAETLLGQVCQLKPDGPAFYFYGLMLARNGRLPEARRALETALDRYRGQLSSDQQHTAAQALDIWRQTR